MKKLTIGSATYDDFDGVYFTYQSLRLNNQNILDDLDFLIIDNNPESAEGRATASFCSKTGIRYIPYTERQGTAVRNELFTHAEGEYTLCIDSHVLFKVDSIKKLLTFLDASGGSEDLYHGAMLYDDIIHSDPVVQMDRVWRDHMLGIWASGKIKNKKPFEIPMHGLGVFVCKTDAWLGFNEKFSGFGGEEGYIHEKFHQAGRKVWCLPFLKWVHRFQRPRGVVYPLDLKDRIRNYLIGFLELGKDVGEIIEHFQEEAPDIDCMALLGEVSTMISPESSPVAFEPTSTWSVSSIKFNTPPSFRYFKMEVFGDCLLRGVKILCPHPPSPDLSVHFFSDKGVDNVNAILERGEDKFCTIHSPVAGCSVILSASKSLSPLCMNISHSNTASINCYTSEDEENWDLISEIKV